MVNNFEKYEDKTNKEISDMIWETKKIRNLSIADAIITGTIGATVLGLSLIEGFDPLTSVAFTGASVVTGMFILNSYKFNKLNKDLKNFKYLKEQSDKIKSLK